MTQVTAFEGADILVKISTTAKGTTLTHYCSINGSRGLTLNTENSSSVLPDCDKPKAPGWKTTRITGLGMSISGAGVAHKADVKVLSDILIAGVSVAGIVEVGGAGGATFSGKFVLTSMAITGERLEDSTFDISLESDGAITTAVIASE